MRAPTLNRRTAVAFNMTPMIDIVFLLIIFFLLSSHLVRREAHLPLPLPAAVTGEEDARDSAPRIILNVTESGQILLAGHPMPADRLEDRLRRAAGSDPHEVELRIRADRTVPYHHVAPILLAAAHAQIWNVTFAVYPPHELP